jgi:transposase
MHAASNRPDTCLHRSSSHQHHFSLAQWGPSTHDHGFVDTGLFAFKGSMMAKTRLPYAAEFRRQMVELVRAGRTPEELASEFEPTDQSIRNWVAQSERNAGRGDGGLMTAEREELNRLRRENRQLRLERDPLKGGGLVRSGDERDPCERFRFVSDHQAAYPTATMCELLGVSSSGSSGVRRSVPRQT